MLGPPPLAWDLIPDAGSPSSAATFAPFRRRGHATAAVRAFLDEVIARGCPHASPCARAEAAHLYKVLGFADLTNAVTLDPR